MSSSVDDGVNDLVLQACAVDAIEQVKRGLGLDNTAARDPLTFNAVVTRARGYLANPDRPRRVIFPRFVPEAGTLEAPTLEQRATLVAVMLYESSMGYGL